MAQRESDLLTHAEYARHRKALRLPGGTREAVSNAVSEGRISTINGKIHPLIADSEWAKNTRARVSPQAAAAPALPAPAAGDLVAQATAAPAPAITAAPAAIAPAIDPGYNIHRAKREKADAEIAAMTAAKMAGEMVMRADVDRAIFEIGREARDRLTSCARRIAGEVASLTSAEACEKVIDREHRIVLELLVSYSQKMGARPQDASTSTKVDV